MPGTTSSKPRCSASASPKKISRSRSSPFPADNVPASLAKLLINEPDLLLLDEPTNHLDIAAVEWLENYLLNFSGAMLVISHDRYLLDRIATRIVWLTRRQLSSYPGNYSSFAEQRELAELTQQRQFQEQQADIAKQAEYIRRFKAGQRARQAKGREKRLNRLLSSDQVVQSVGASKQMHIKLSTDQRAGDRLLRVEDLSKSFDGKKVWNDVKFDLKRGERVGVIGPNGSGKTTLLRTLTGEYDADSGDIRWGTNITIGYYDQKLDDFDPDLSIFDEVLSEVEGYNEQQLRDALGAMLFRGDDIEKPMRLLSGGERARVALTKLLLQRPNVLLLDEPTNHLDIQSCEALERTLGGFEGSIVCVSHDRSFLDRIAKRLLVIDPAGLIDFEGNWTKWAQKQREKQSESKPQAKAPPKAAPVPKPAPTPVAEKPKTKKDNPYARKFGRLTTGELERKIADTERKIAKLNTDLADPAIFKNPQKAKQIQTEVEAASSDLQGLEEEYLTRDVG
jgi:ATP-binding cassette, subfamily F, member 3